MRTGPRTTPPWRPPPLPRWASASLATRRISSIAARHACSWSKNILRILPDLPHRWGRRRLAISAHLPLNSEHLPAACFHAPFAHGTADPAHAHPASAELGECGRMVDAVPHGWWSLL